MTKDLLVPWDFSAVDASADLERCKDPSGTPCKLLIEGKSMKGGFHDVGFCAVAYYRWLSEALAKGKFVDYDPSRPKGQNFVGLKQKAIEAIQSDNHIKEPGYQSLLDCIQGFSGFADGHEAIAQARRDAY